MSKVEELIVTTLKLGGMTEEKSKQAAEILSKYLRLKSPAHTKKEALL